MLLADVITRAEISENPGYIPRRQGTTLTAAVLRECRYFWALAPLRMQDAGCARFGTNYCMGTCARL
jgi:hypothetical protein